MSNLSDAFNSLLSIHHRSMTLERLGEFSAIPVKVTPSNYARNIAGPEDTTIAGREYIIPKGSLTSDYIPPQRGDQLHDTELGYQTVVEVIEMYDVGAKIMGYRVRCS